MIKCPYCESTVSEFANTCPNCGKAISKDIMQKELERKKNNNIEKAEKRKLRELGKEKYLPLVMFTIATLFFLSYAMSRTYAKYGEVKVGVTLSSRINAIIILVILFIIPTSFMTKIYQSSRGYIFRNIQMGIDIYSIVMSTPLVLRYTINIAKINIFQKFDFWGSVFLYLGYIVSLILCIRMKKNRNVKFESL